MIDFEDVHPPRGTVMKRPFQETRTKQQIERPRDLREIVADVGGELLTAEHDARMPREEEQQVEITRVPQASRFNELKGHRVGREDLLDDISPSREDQRSGDQTAAKK